MTPMQGQPCDARYAAHEATYESCAALSSESLDGRMNECFLASGTCLVSIHPSPSGAWWAHAVAVGGVPHNPTLTQSLILALTLTN